jgi:hypothetical protein
MALVRGRTEPAQPKRLCLTQRGTMLRPERFTQASQGLEAFFY